MRQKLTDMRQQSTDVWHQPTDMPLILQQPADMPLILKQTIPVRQQPPDMPQQPREPHQQQRADMPLILKQTNNRHATHTNKQPTDISLILQQPTDMSQQIGCRSE
jgi:hypothetical protein